MVRRRMWRRGAYQVIAIVGIFALVNLAGTIRSSAADHGAPVVEALARSSFVEDVAVQIRVQHDTLTVERDLDDASDVVIVKITIAPGVRAPWHAHAGPGILVNAGPGTLTSTISDDCQARDYPMGAALVDPGGGTLHSAINDSSEEVVLYAIFLGVGNGPVIPADPPPDCDF
jgi:quercetin dioxygenase-like cupin family protein